MTICRIVVTVFAVTLTIPVVMADFAGRLNSKGEFSLDDGKFSLISGDILYVKDTEERCKYLIPEDEIPQFATLLQPLNKPTERKKIFLDIQKNLNRENSEFICEGEKDEVVKFGKKYLISNGGVLIQIVYKLDKTSDSIVYAMKIPTGYFSSKVEIIDYRGKSRNLLVKKELTKGKNIEGIVSLILKGKERKISFSSTDKHYFSIINGKGEDSDYYFLWKAKDTGTIKIKVKTLSSAIQKNGNTL